MKRFPEFKNTAPMFIVVFFLSVIIVLGIMEFGFLKNILNNHEDSIKQIAINKTTLFLNDLKAVSENAGKKYDNRGENPGEALKTISAFDHRIVNVYILKPDGSVRASLHPRGNDVPLPVKSLIRERVSQRATISGVHTDPSSHLNIVSGLVRLPGGSGEAGGTMVVDFKIDQYQKEMMHEFINKHYKIAVFDGNNYPVFWPFDKEKIGEFDGTNKRFFVNREQYNVLYSEVGDQPWRLYFFFKENNFETFRTIAILFLVFALYCCLYQLLVELWGVNSIRTYFENIDFAIFNQINEGVIITNNSGRIIFANSSAHEIFSQRKSSLVGIKLNEILGHIEDIHDEKEKSHIFTLKMPDKFLEAIHSPIIKKGKILGSLTVIRVNAKEEKTIRAVLGKFIEIIPEGVLYVDKNHEVSMANLMARCFLGSLNKGASIDVVRPDLAEAVYENIGSGSVKRIEMQSYGLICEIAPVYDDDGVYAGTLVVLFPSGTMDE
ncbi:MAG: PAS domain-containing protein [Bacillota bacterium]